MLKIDRLRTAHIGPFDFSIDDGQCCTVMGTSGAGKSLMLRAIADLDVNHGTAWLDDTNRNDMDASDWRRLVAYVPAESGWWADRVADHFVDPASSAALLAALGLPDALNWEVNRLSTGERHRLAIARALALHPRAILLDEPSAALDDDATHELETLLRAQQNGGASLLLVTHDPQQASRMGDQSFVMKNGQLLAADSQIR